MEETQRDSLERIVPDAMESGAATGDETLQLHLERYAFAKRMLPSGRVLDLACGVGYGTAMLAASASRQVIGGDISGTAIRHARQNYLRPGVSFVRGDGAAWIRPGTIDGIVSLETLEHVLHPDRLFENFVHLLRPGGMLIASVPVTPSVDANPHHLTDFTPASFRRLGERHGLRPIDSLDQVQTFSPVSILARREQRTRDLRVGLLRYYTIHPGALARRIVAVVRFGFTNRYLTVAWRKGANQVPPPVVDGP